MGCLPGNTVELLQIAPLRSFILDINGSHLAFVLRQLRVEVELIKINNDQPKYQCRFNRQP
jgi:ferrous iron transport protein A